MKKTKPGDIVAYRSWSGQGVRICKVIDSYANIKNGRPGFDAELLPESEEFCSDDEDRNMVWGYDYQIIAINNEAPA